MPPFIFLDVGNVLLDEDRLTHHVFLRHVAAIRAVRPDLSFLDLLCEREALAASGSRWPLHDLMSRYLDPPRIASTWALADADVRARYPTLCPPVAGASALLDALIPRARLGLIANQPRECRPWLESLGWLDRFAVVVLSEEVGLFKPDPAPFRLALERAGVAPGDALLIGDRLDNDIFPAARLGMPTLWVRWPERRLKGWSPADPDASAYLRSLERTSSLLASHPHSPPPGPSVATIAEVPDALDTLFP